MATTLALSYWPMKVDLKTSLPILPKPLIPMAATISLSMWSSVTEMLVSPETVGPAIILTEDLGADFLTEALLLLMSAAPCMDMLIPPVLVDWFIWMKRAVSP